MTRVFLSHSSSDKDEIQALRKALADRGVAGWEDVLTLRLGDTLADLRTAIQTADGFVLYLTPRAIGSEWVQREAMWALEAKAAKPGYALLPVLRGLDRPALRLLFGAADLVSIVLGDDDRIESAVPAVAQALGLAPQDATPRKDPVPAPPMADLILELTEPRKHQDGGVLRAAAKARVSYRPAGGGRGVDGAPIDFVAPIGPIEAEDLAWYLESYIHWPFGTFQERAKKIEASLPRWGRALFDALPGRPEQAQAVRDFRDGKGNPVGEEVARRVTILVDDRGANADAEAAAMLLALPWELLSDEKGYLFEGRLKARVRRALPSTEAMEPAEPRVPLRVLLLMARPDDAGFLDPRSSTLPLVEALEDLGSDVELTVLGSGTVKALRDALDQGVKEGRPYQVVHFDGHGVYDRKTGLGQLCFEDAEDAAQGKVVRKMDRVGADRIGALLRDYRVPLFVLEACQTASAEASPAASVAAALLRSGVASVVAMSHSVLVETARRFVGAFYKALAEGDKIGTAMVRAQRALRDNVVRGEVKGQGRIELQDWLVPVLFQEDADARLFAGGVDMRAAVVADRQLQAKVKRGALSEPPAHGFVGRARALLTIDRELQRGKWLALLGRGGEGKTALAVEAARWLLAMRRVERVAFVSVETVGDARAVLDTIGRQVVAGYSVAVAEGLGSEEDKLRRAMLPVQQVLQERRVLLVIDNLESVLPKPAEEPSADVVELLDMLRTLAETGATKLLLTSRESVPAPLGGREYRVPALSVREAEKLLAGVLKSKGQEPKSDDDKEHKEAIEGLVDAVGGHPRSLVLLGELVAERGIAAVTADLRVAMAELEARYPDERERSLLASVRLSLKRLPKGVRKKVRGLGVFHGVAPLPVMARVLQIEDVPALFALSHMLVAVGLATMDGPYLLMDPGLAPALAAKLGKKKRQAAAARWLEAMQALASFLYEQRFQDAQIAAHGARVALGELLAALYRIEREVEAGRFGASRAIDYVVRLEALVSSLGLSRALAVISAARQEITKCLPAWSHARFNAESEQVDRSYEAGDLPGALAGARAVRKAAEKAGDAYPEAAYDRAMACWRLGRMLTATGHVAEALGLLDEARKRFFTLAAAGDERAARMESTAICEKGNVLTNLGKLDEAAGAYEESAKRSKALNDTRTVAVARGQLGTVRLLQSRFKDALAAYEEAKTTFEKLGEPGSVAGIWHQIGNIHQGAGNLDAAEHAYRQALALQSAHGDRAGEASTLNNLGTLYAGHGRLEEAASFYQQAADRYHVLGNALDESSSHSNLAIVLHQLRRFDGARAALHAAQALKKRYGSSAEPWNIWAALADLERDAGNLERAAEARAQSIATYRAYRDDGGQPKNAATQLIADFGATLRASGPAAARALLPGSDEVHASFTPTVRALHAVADGSRDPALASDPAQHPLAVVELTLLLAALPPT